LRFSEAGIIIDWLKGQQTPNRIVHLGNVEACSVWVVPNPMEAAMYKNLASIIGTLAIVSAALLASSHAEAGASASAPSKYAYTTQVAAAHQVRADRQARRSDFPITEYSSSSAKNPLHGQAYR
jgi:hypothetical protein